MIAGDAVEDQRPEAAGVHVRGDDGDADDRDGSDAQYEDLRTYLEGQRRAGRLVYGMHKSSEALVTCIVFSYNGNHVHFVDGSDGGYAMAARGLKAQLKSVAA